MEEIYGRKVYYIPMELEEWKQNGICKVDCLVGKYGFYFSCRPSIINGKINKYIEKALKNDVSRCIRVYKSEYTTYFVTFTSERVCLFYPKLSKDRLDFINDNKKYYSYMTLLKKRNKIAKKEHDDEFYNNLIKEHEYVCKLQDKKHKQQKRNTRTIKIH